MWLSHVRKESVNNNHITYLTTDLTTDLTIDLTTDITTDITTDLTTDLTIKLLLSDYCANNLFCYWRICFRFHL